MGADLGLLYELVLLDGLVQVQAHLHVTPHLHTYTHHSKQFIYKTIRPRHPDQK